jgi:S1-C subfamily serine protease
LSGASLRAPKILDDYKNSYIFIPKKGRRNMSLLPKDWLDSVVALETTEDNKEFRTIATGFLVGFKTGEKNESGEDLFATFLITNRHVLKGKKKIWLRFNKGDGTKRYDINLLEEKTGKETWLAHKNEKIDIAALPLSFEELNKEGVIYKWIPENRMAFFEQMKQLGIREGDEVFVLGFPMGIAGEEKKYVVTRAGMIARLDDEIIRKFNAFLIDASIFPGNSGGPVIFKPTNVSFMGSTPVSESFLIGVVQSYITYSETAYSLQTDPPQPRINFIENSGLAFVIPLDYVRETVLDLISKKTL